MTGRKLRRESFFLFADALFAITDEAFDIIMLFEYAENGDWTYFYIGLATIVLPVILCRCNCCCGVVITAEAFMNIFPCLGPLWGGMLSDLVLMIPALNLLALALGDVVLDFDDNMYKNIRAFEAIFEATPQAILQLYVALGQPEGIDGRILLISLGLSLLSLTKTLVSFFIFQDLGIFSHPTHVSHRDSLSRLTKAKMFLLSFFYAFFEVASKVLSIALLGYFCGGGSIVAAITLEYALLLAYLYVAGFNVCDPFDSDRHGNWRYLFLPFTSFVCGRATSFHCCLLLRLVILGAYAAVTILSKEEVVCESLCQAFVWIVACATGLWALLLPAFVNSCHNLRIAFFSWSEERIVPTRFSKFYYPLEIHSNDRVSGVCSCPRKGLSQLADGGLETTVNVAAISLAIGSCA